MVLFVPIVFVCGVLLPQHAIAQKTADGKKTGAVPSAITTNKVDHSAGADLSFRKKNRNWNKNTSKVSTKNNKVKKGNKTFSNSGGKTKKPWGNKPPSSNYNKKKGNKTYSKSSVEGVPIHGKTSQHLPTRKRR